MYVQVHTYTPLIVALAHYFRMCVCGLAVLQIRRFLPRVRRPLLKERKASSKEQ